VATAALPDPGRSALAPGLLEAPYLERCAGPDAELPGTLRQLVDHLERQRRLWEQEHAALAAGEAALAAGSVTIDEVSDLDLAVVSISASHQARLATRFSSRHDAACHPAAINNATNALRILTVQGQRYELVYRYESW